MSEMRIPEFPEITMGMRLRMARKEAGIREEAMGKVLKNVYGRELSKNTIQSWESGATSPPGHILIEVLRIWSETTSVPFWWLAGLNDEDIQGFQSLPTSRQNENGSLPTGRQKVFKIPQKRPTQLKALQRTG